MKIIIVITIALHLIVKESSALKINASANHDWISRRLIRSANECGKSKTSAGLVVGGQSLKRGDFPWIVALLFWEDIDKHSYFCGGTLISPTFVISGKFLINGGKKYK